VTGASYRNTEYGPSSQIRRYPSAEERGVPPFNHPHADRRRSNRQPRQALPTVLKFLVSGTAVNIDGDTIACVYISRGAGHLHRSDLMPAQGLADDIEATRRRRVAKAAVAIVVVVLFGMVQLHVFP
jgi:hypothetical protein